MRSKHGRVVSSSLNRAPALLLSGTVALSASSCWWSSPSDIEEKIKKDLQERPAEEIYLNQQQRNQFDLWKKSPIKSCFASDIVTEGSQEREIDSYLDVSYLQAKSDDKTNLIYQSGDWALVLGSPILVRGETHSQLSHSFGFDGDQSETQIRTEMKSGLCRVFLGDEQVFSTYLAEKVPIWWAQGEATERQLSFEYTVSTQQDHVIGNNILESFAASSQGNHQVTQELLPVFFEDLDLDKGMVFFDPPRLPSGLRAVIAQGEEEEFVFDVWRKEIPDSMSLAPVLKSSNGDFVLEVLQQAPRALTLPLDSSDLSVQNASDYLTWQVHFALTPDPSPRLRIVDIRFDGVRNLAAKDAWHKCIQNRNDRFTATGLYGVGRFSPGYEGSVAPCWPLSGMASLMEYLESSDTPDLIISLIRKHFHFYEESGWVHYMGWDTALKDLAWHSLKEGASLVEVLNYESSSEAPFIYSLEEAGRSLWELMSEFPGLSDYHQMIYQGWVADAMLQELDVETSEFKTYLEALDSVHTALPNSAQVFIAAVGRDRSILQQANYALLITDEQKLKISELQLLADQLKVKDDLNRLYFYKLLQQRPAELEELLSQIEASLLHLRSLRERDFKAMDGSFRLGYDNDFKQLAGTALSERWQEREFRHLELFATLVRQDPFCGGFADTAKAFVCKVKRVFAVQEQNIFAPHYGERYAALSSEFLGHLQGLRDEDIFLARKLVDSFFRPVWDACNDGEFADARKQLTLHIQNFAAGDYSERHQIKTEIDNLLNKCS